MLRLGFNSPDEQKGFPMRITIAGLLICALFLVNAPGLAAQSGGTLKWKFLTGTIYNSSPAIGSDGVVYIGGDDKYLYAINPGGTLKWKFLTGNSVYSSPSIGSDGTVYVGSQDNYLYAINSTGALKWKFQTGNNVYSSPAIGSDGTVYVGSLDNYLYAISPAGALKWKFLTGNSVFSSPAVGSDGTVYVGCYDNSLYAINPAGTLKWKFLTGSQIFSSPAIGNDGTVYVGSLDNYLYAINPVGTLKWNYKTGSSVDSSPSIGSDGTVYVGSVDKYLYAINPSGSLKWKYLSGGKISPAPAIGSDGAVYFGCDDNYLYSINSSGALKWKFQTAATVYSSPAIGGDGTVYVGSYDDYLYAVNIGVTGGLANSAWPKKHHDNQNTGRGVTATTGTISGTITNSSDGYGISWAKVTVTPGNYTGTTNSSGGYSIANIPPGISYMVTATATNYNGGSKNAVTVTSGSATTVNLALTLSTTATLYGTITEFSTNAPISGATVTVTPGNYTGTTNSSGEYTISNIPSSASTYTVTVTKTNYYRGYQNEVMLTIAYPNKLDLKMTYISPTTGMIVGKITHSILNGGIAYAKVTVTPGNYTGTTNIYGEYIIPNIPAGKYTVEAVAYPYENGYLAVTVSMGYPTTVNIALNSESSIYPFVADNVHSPGDEFTVTIKASIKATNNAEKNLFGAGIVLEYTQSSFLTVKSVEPQGFLGSDLIFFSEQNRPGYVRIGVTAKNPAPGKNGDGILARVTFQSVSTTPENTPVIFSIDWLEAFNSLGNYLHTINFSRTDTLMIRTLPLTVWPGDMDNDGDVDQADVLKLGVYYGKTGPDRDGNDMTWSAKECLPWTPKEATFADAIGDGFVTHTDIVAIGVNWGKTHAVAKITAPPPVTAERTSGTLCLRSDAVFPLREGTEFWMDVNVANAVSLFGLSFILRDQSGIITPLSAEQGTFLGSNPIFFPQANTEKGTIAVGISRKSGESGLDGSGTVVRIKCKALRDVEKEELIAYVFRDIVANDASGNAITLAATEGSIGDLTGVHENHPLGFRLAPNFPNPFNPYTTITFTIPESGMVSLMVYDVSGRLVRTLVSRTLSAGTFSETWNGRDDYGRPVSSGVYVSRLTQGSHSAVSKMVLMK